MKSFFRKRGVAVAVALVVALGVWVVGAYVTGTSRVAENTPKIALSPLTNTQSLTPIVIPIDSPEPIATEEPAEPIEDKTAPPKPKSTSKTEGSSGSGSSAIESQKSPILPPKVVPPAIPVAPTGLSGQAVCTGDLTVDVTLSWQATTSEFASGYDVYRSTDGSTFSKIAHVTGRLTTLYVETDIDPDPLKSTYTYKVRSTAPDGNSPYSAPASVSIPFPCAQR